MKAALSAALTLMFACGSNTSSRADGGAIDTSCGLDCAAQEHYGLIINRCFEYSGDATKKDPPSLGVQVLPVFTLDNKVKVLPVEYRQGGQLRMRDSFSLKDGDLLLARREFTASNSSVTYRDSSLTISGVKWLASDSATGETFTTPSKALILGASGSPQQNDSTYRVTTAVPSPSELKTPLREYSTGLKLLMSESPTGNGNDTRRVFVPGVGFVLIATPFALTGGSAEPMMLQRVRDIGSAGGGSTDCSMGAP